MILLRNVENVVRAASSEKNKNSRPHEDIYVYIQVKTTELAITNRRTIAKFGWIRRSTIEMYNLKIESIQVEQGIAGRIFNYGSIILSGAGNPQAPIPGIADPMAFRRALLQQTGLN